MLGDLRLQIGLPREQQRVGLAGAVFMLAARCLQGLQRILIGLRGPRELLLIVLMSLLSAVGEPQLGLALPASRGGELQRGVRVGADELAGGAVSAAFGAARSAPCGAGADSAGAGRRGPEWPRETPSGRSP